LAHLSEARFYLLIFLDMLLWDNQPLTGYLKMTYEHKSLLSPERVAIWPHCASEPMEPAPEKMLEM